LVYQNVFVNFSKGVSKSDHDRIEEVDQNNAMPNTSMPIVTKDANIIVDTAITNEGNEKDLSQEQHNTIDVDDEKNTDSNV